MCLIIPTPLQVYIKLIVSLLLSFLLFYIFWKNKNIIQDSSAQYQTITNNIQCNTKLNSGQLQVTCNHHGNIIEQTYETHDETLTSKVKREIDIKYKNRENDGHELYKNKRTDETGDNKDERTRGVYPNVDTWILTALLKESHKKQTQDEETQEDTHKNQIIKTKQSEGEIRSANKPDILPDFEKKYRTISESTEATRKRLENNFLYSKEYDIGNSNDQQNINADWTQPRYKYFQKNAHNRDLDKEKLFLDKTNSKLSENQYHTDRVRKENYNKKYQNDKHNLNNEISSEVEETNIKEDLEKSLILEYLTSGKIKLGKWVIKHRSQENKQNGGIYENENIRTLGDLDIIYDENMEENLNELVSLVSTEISPKPDRDDFSKINKTEANRMQIVKPTNECTNSLETHQNQGFEDVTNTNGTEINITEKKLKHNKPKLSIEQIYEEKKELKKKEITNEILKNEETNEVQRQPINNGTLANFHTNNSELYNLFRPTNFNYETNMHRDLSQKNNDDISINNSIERSHASEKMDLIPDSFKQNINHKSKKRYYGIENDEEGTLKRNPNKFIKDLINFLDNEENFLKINQDYRIMKPVHHARPIFATNPTAYLDTRDNSKYIHTPISHANNDIESKHNMKDVHNGYNSFFYRQKGQKSRKNSIDLTLTTRPKITMLTTVELAITPRPKTTMLSKVKQTSTTTPKTTMLTKVEQTSTPTTKTTMITKVEPTLTPKPKTTMITKVEPTMATSPKTAILTKSNMDNTFIPLKTKYEMEKDFKQNNAQPRTTQLTRPKYVYNDTFNDTDELYSNKITLSIKQTTMPATKPEIEESTTLRLSHFIQNEDYEKTEEDGRNSLREEMELLIEERSSSSPTTEVTTTLVTTLLPFDSYLQSFHGKPTSLIADLNGNNQINVVEQNQDSKKYTEININKSTTSIIKPTTLTYHYNTFTLSIPIKTQENSPQYQKKELKITMDSKQIPFGKTTPHVYSKNTKIQEQTKTTPLKTNEIKCSQYAEIETVMDRTTIPTSTLTSSIPITSNKFYNKYQNNIKMQRNTQQISYQQSPISSSTHKVSVQNEKDLIWRRLMKQKLQNDVKYKAPFLYIRPTSTPVKSSTSLKSSLSKNSVGFLPRTGAVNFPKSPQPGVNTNSTHNLDMNNEKTNKTLQSSIQCTMSTLFGNNKKPTTLTKRTQNPLLIKTSTGRTSKMVNMKKSYRYHPARLSMNLLSGVREYNLLRPTEEIRPMATTPTLTTLGTVMKPILTTDRVWNNSIILQKNISIQYNTRSVEDTIVNANKLLPTNLQDNLTLNSTLVNTDSDKTEENNRLLNKEYFKLYTSNMNETESKTPLQINSGTNDCMTSSSTTPLFTYHTQYYEDKISSTENEIETQKIQENKEINGTEEEKINAPDTSYIEGTDRNRQIVVTELFNETKLKDNHEAVENTTNINEQKHSTNRLLDVINRKQSRKKRFQNEMWRQPQTQMSIRSPRSLPKRFYQNQAHVEKASDSMTQLITKTIEQAKQFRKNLISTFNYILQNRSSYMSPVLYDALWKLKTGLKLRLVPSIDLIRVLANRPTQYNMKAEFSQLFRSIAQISRNDLKLAATVWYESIDDDTINMDNILDDKTAYVAVNSSDIDSNNTECNRDCYMKAVDTIEHKKLLGDRMIMLSGCINLHLISITKESIWLFNLLHLLPIQSVSPQYEETLDFISNQMRVNKREMKFAIDNIVGAKDEQIKSRIITRGIYEFLCSLIKGLATVTRNTTLRSACSLIADTLKPPNIQTTITPAVRTPRFILPLHGYLLLVLNDPHTPYDIRNASRQLSDGIKLRKLVSTKLQEQLFPRMYFYYYDTDWETLLGILERLYHNSNLLSRVYVSDVTVVHAYVLYYHQYIVKQQSIITDLTLFEHNFYTSHLNHTLRTVLNRLEKELNPKVNSSTPILISDLYNNTIPGDPKNTFVLILKLMLVKFETDDNLTNLIRGFFAAYNSVQDDNGGDANSKRKLQFNPVVGQNNLLKTQNIRTYKQNLMKSGTSKSIENPTTSRIMKNKIIEETRGQEVHITEHEKTGSEVEEISVYKENNKVEPLYNITDDPMSSTYPKDNDTSNANKTIDKRRTKKMTTAMSLGNTLYKPKERKTSQRNIELWNRGSKNVPKGLKTVMDFSDEMKNQVEETERTYQKNAFDPYEIKKDERIMNNKGQIIDSNIAYKRRSYNMEFERNPIELIEEKNSEETKPKNELLETKHARSKNIKSTLKSTNPKPQYSSQLRQLPLYPDMYTDQLVKK